MKDGGFSLVRLLPGRDKKSISAFGCNSRYKPLPRSSLCKVKIFPSCWNCHWLWVIGLKISLCWKPPDSILVRVPITNFQSTFDQYLNISFTLSIGQQTFSSSNDDVNLVLDSIPNFFFLCVLYLCQQNILHLVWAKPRLLHDGPLWQKDDFDWKSNQNGADSGNVVFTPFTD